MKLFVRYLVNNKTNLFVCALSVLSINLQYNITAYAAEENDIIIEDITPIETVDEATTTEITNGPENLSAEILAPDDQTQSN